MIMMPKEPGRWSNAVAEAERSAGLSCGPICRFIQAYKDGVSMRTAMLWTKYPAKDQLPQLQAAVDAYMPLNALLPLDAARALAFTRDGLNDWFRAVGNDGARIMLSEAIRFGLVRVGGYVGHTSVEIDHRQLSAAQVDLEQDRIMFGGTWFELVTLWPGSEATPVPAPKVPGPPSKPAGKRDATPMEINKEIMKVLGSYGKDEDRHPKAYALGDYDRTAKCQVLHVRKSKKTIYAQVVKRLELANPPLRMPYTENTFMSYTKTGSGHELNESFDGKRLVYKGSEETQAKPGRSPKKV
jgi:hypothetical protein